MLPVFFLNIEKIIKNYLILCQNMIFNIYFTLLPISPKDPYDYRQVHPLSRRKTFGLVFNRLLKTSENIF